MKTITRDGQTYRLPGNLTPFQQELYVHLINWKWRNITKEPGIYEGIAYDAILPEACQREQEWPHLYPDIVTELQRHLSRNDFRIHKHFYHMASSQAATINLFLPVLLHSDANALLRAIKPDVAALATDYLDNGYCIEYWGGNFDEGGSKVSLLNDKSAVSGTDSDIAIAYYNQQGELCLWLIEHKLTEKEFTSCGGFKSPGRKEQHDCGRSFADMLTNKQGCYYHDVRGFNYWNITDTNRDRFVNHAKHDQCPFQGGTNQLWRNQLLGLSIEQDERLPYQHVHFSVVKHRANTALDASLATYYDLIAHHPMFSTFTSLQVIKSAEQQSDRHLDRWVAWYCDIYNP